jgi:oligopeptide transport system permease protein
MDLSPIRPQASMPLSSLETSDLKASDFVSAIRKKTDNSISRPSLSYWQDALRRFKKNKQALVAFMLATFLLLFVFVGPSIYTIDPNEQDPNQANLAPSLGQDAIVISDPVIWDGITAADHPAQPTENIENLPAPQNLSTVEVVSTQSVKLSWSTVAGAAGYQVYRSEVAIESGSLGVPLGDTAAGNIVSYEDNASLESKEYHYAVVAKNLDGNESTEFSTLSVVVRPGLSLEAAQVIRADAQVGETVRLRAAPLGTDSLGRDLLARVMYGGRISLFIGLFCAFSQVLIGVIIGGVAGYFGGRVDDVLMRVSDFVLGLPFLLFVILLKVVFSSGAGDSGVVPMMIALIVLSWPGAARLVRGQILQLRESEFVHAARMMGATPRYLLLRHLFPNLLGIILVSLTFGVPVAIFSEAFLSFVGLGISAPAASWGSLCNDAIQSILTRPHEFFFPALLISITVLAYNLLGDGMRDALDPKLRSNE